MRDQTESDAAATAPAECVIAVDERGCVTAFNDAAEQAFGYGREDVLGRPFADLIARRSDEDELREIRKRLHVATEAAKLGTWSFDLRTGQGWYSDRSKEIMGLPADAVITAKAVKGFVHPDDWQKVAEPYYHGVPESSVEIEYRIVRPDGEIRWIYALGAATKDEDGVTRTVDGVHVDITDRKLAEFELARSREALHQSEKLAALGSLLAGVSHALNNPLAAIVGQAQMLEEDSRGTPLELRARKISAAAERCARIVQTFLAMARRRPPQRVAIDANKLAAAALELGEYGLRTAGIAVRTDFAPVLPAVEGDSDQLHQVLINLVINAQQAMDTGGGRGHVLTVRTSLTAAGTVAIDICDTGPGIPPEVAARIFEPFFTTKPQGSGTGVGLSFSHGVVAAHGGSLTLLPSERGAAFRVELPAAAGAGRAVAQAAPDRPPAGRASLGKALIIDDEGDVADTLRELVEREGFAVTMVADGAAALAAVEEDHDIIFSDLRMPGMGGPEFFRRLQASRPDRAERVAFVTGDTLGAAMADFLADAGRPVLEKPFTVGAVRDLIRALQDQGRRP
ncbi:MAG TPA: ATP-binding protein [Allosphingosinicella sp.]|nr:ATP-binding protein [Allosphingosinicella sp.]